MKFTLFITSILFLSDPLFAFDYEWIEIGNDTITGAGFARSWDDAVEDCYEDLLDQVEDAVNACCEISNGNPTGGLCASNRDTDAVRVISGVRRIDTACQPDPGIHKQLASGFWSVESAEIEWTCREVTEIIE